MPRPLRVQFPGAIYHLMSRGDHRDPTFRDDFDRRRCAAPDHPPTHSKRKSDGRPSRT